MNPNRSHRTTKKNTMVHRVDRRNRGGGKAISENGKSPGFVPGMQLKPRGYGTLDELEKRLKQFDNIKPTTI